MTEGDLHAYSVAIPTTPRLWDRVGYELAGVISLEWDGWSWGEWGWGWVGVRRGGVGFLRGTPSSSVARTLPPWHAPFLRDTPYRPQRSSVWSLWNSTCFAESPPSYAAATDTVTRTDLPSSMGSSMGSSRVPAGSACMHSTHSTYSTHSTLLNSLYFSTHSALPHSLYLPYLSMLYLLHSLYLLPRASERRGAQ